MIVLIILASIFSLEAEVIKEHPELDQDTINNVRLEPGSEIVIESWVKKHHGKDKQEATVHFHCKFKTSAGRLGKARYCRPYLIEPGIEQ